MQASLQRSTNISSFLKEIQQSVNPTTSKFKFTTELAWKPDFTLLALGLDDGTVHVFSAPHLTLLHTLFTIKKMIQCLAWHPESTATDTGLSPYRHWLAVSSNERTITVVDTSKLTKGESDINNKTIKSCFTLTGHLNRVVSMAWSPHVSGQLVSVSFDDTAQVWDVPNQSLVANFPSHESNLLCCVWSPLDPDMIITGSADCTLRVWKISSQTNKFPKEKTDHLTPRVISHINKKSFFPVSSRRREDDSYQIENCYRLLERGGQDEIINKDTPSEEGGELGFHHFYGNREDIHTLINAEVAEHRTKGREMLISHMELWKGNTGEMLREASRKKALNDWLVSLAPSISHRVWVEMCVAYSEQLTVQGLFHKAASYLLVCNKVEEAIQLLVNNKCFREAMCIAKSRLDSDDPTINNVFIEWGNKLGNSDGNFVQAAECYLASGELDLAAKMFAKKKTAEYLKLSALVSRKCGNYALALSQAKQCFQECMHQENWDLADDIVSEYMELKPYHLVVIVHREVLNLLAADQGKFGSWLLGNRLIDTSLLERVASRWQTDDKQTVYSELHSGLDHNQSAQQTLNQMWLCVSKELSLSFSSEEKGLWHLVNAVAICYRYQLLHPSQPVLLQLCSWLAPAGPFTKGSVFLLSSQDTSNMSFVHSLRAFLGAAIAFWLDIVVKLSEDLEQQSPLGVNGKSKNDNEQITEPNEECDAHTRDLINNKNITIKSQEINKSITVIESAEGMTDTQKVVEGVKEEVNDILEKIINVCGNKPNKEIKCNEKDDTKTKTNKEFIESKIDISSSNIDASKITCVGVSDETTCVFEHSGSLNWAAVCTVLEELLVDVLDKHSTQYFQNEIEIKKLELLVAGAVASTRKSSALGESPKHIEDNNVAEDRNENKIDDAINHNMRIEVTEAHTENGVVEGKKKDQVLFDTISDTNIIKNSILNEDNQTIADAQFGTGYSVLRGNSYLNEGEPTPTAAHLVQGHNSRDTFTNSGLLKLKELKNCKEKFEMEKVAVPNPFFIYCKVQTICQNVIMKKEPQLGQRLLDLLKNSL
uniref:Gem-associated protein 5 n=1 Tax=Timema monikensis TaxID=170555 RepID=A0A7R9E666_9NEOP|nr:unnamed protein product [Timema monikensis]